VIALLAEFVQANSFPEFVQANSFPEFVQANSSREFVQANSSREFVQANSSPRVRPGENSGARIRHTASDSTTPVIVRRNNGARFPCRDFVRRRVALVTSVASRDDRAGDRLVDGCGRDCGAIAKARDLSRVRMWTTVWASRFARTGTTAAITSTRQRGWLSGSAAVTQAREAGGASFR